MTEDATAITEPDLDRLVEWAATERPETTDAVNALVAEVRRLRADPERLAAMVRALGNAPGVSRCIGQPNQRDTKNGAPAMTEDLIPNTSHVQYRENWPHPPTLVVDGVDITNKVVAGSLRIEHRHGLPPLVTFTLAADVSFEGDAEIAGVSR